MHGTTSIRVEQIQLKGFKPPAIENEIAALALKYEENPIRVFEDLSLHMRFTAGRRGDQHIYLAVDIEQAHSYAARAPEFEWEVLWAIYRLRNPALGMQWLQSDEGHWWVLKQQIEDAPVVFRFQVDEEDPRIILNPLQSETPHPQGLDAGPRGIKFPIMKPPTPGEPTQAYVESNFLSGDRPNS